MTKTVLVVGATGATGKHVVRQLLEQGHTVRAIVRSKEKMINSLLSMSSSEDTNNNDEQAPTELLHSYYGDRLQLTEATLLDLTDSDLQRLVQNCDAVVSCLGHTMDSAGLWGRKNRRLVTDATTRLTSAMTRTTSTTTTSPKPKFILMSSNGVSSPYKTDDPRPLVERAIIFLIRHLITPHADNEQAAQYLYDMLHQDKNNIKDESSLLVEWCAVRPDDLIDAADTQSVAVSDYELVSRPKSGLFGANVSTRANVAHAMVQLILDDTVWNKWKFQFPVHADTTPMDSES